MDLPSAGAPSALRDDVAAIRGALDALDGPVVLVGHADAGVAITEASAGHAAVGHLVYVCAAMPAEGESNGRPWPRTPAQPAGRGDPCAATGSRG